MPFPSAFLTKIGLNLLDVIDELRNEDDEDLVIQCNVFDDEKQEDDESFAALNPNGVDIDDHNAVFNALYEKVCKILSFIYDLPKYITT